MHRAWIFNLDVERELAARGSYQPPRRALAASSAALPQLREALLGPGDRVLGEACEPREAEGFLGCAWSPSSHALARLRRAGAALPPTPGDEVLARVNRRDFVLEVDPALAQEFGKRLVTRPEALERELAASPTRRFLVRRAFGAAGRGSRSFGGRGADLEAEDPGLGWLRAGLAQGPLVLEPFVEVELELSLHGWLPRGTGPVRIGHPCVSGVSAQRSWQSTRRARPGEWTQAEAAGLQGALERAAGALREAGYFGPFGIDGLRYRRAPGEPLCVQPLGELNARLSMGWATGMGAQELASWIEDR